MFTHPLDRMFNVRKDWRGMCTAQSTSISAMNTHSCRIKFSIIINYVPTTTICKTLRDNLICEEAKIYKKKYSSKELQNSSFTLFFFFNFSNNVSPLISKLVHTNT